MSKLLQSPLFAPLPSYLSEAILDWLKTLIENENGASDAAILEHFHTLIDNGEEVVPGVTPGEWVTIRDWREAANEEDLLDLVRRLRLSKRNGYGRATPSQVSVIEETSEEVGVDFSDLLPSLTRRQADIVCKGLILASEALRITGSRFFRLGSIRRALRAYVRSGER
jgi:hypothetical protein